MKNLSPFTQAVVTILFAIFLFDIMGAIIKHLGERYPPQQLSMFRNLFGLIPSLLVLYFSKQWHEAGRPIYIRQWKLALGRGAFVVLAQFCFYLSLIKMEFATASTIAFAGPLFVTALSIPLLGHTVGTWRWMAVLIGFVGILLVMRPTSDVFNWYTILPLGAAVGYASVSVTARLFDETVPTATINIYSIVAAFVGSTALVFLTDGFVAIERMEDWFWLIGIGIAGGAAVYCLISAYRMTEPSNLSPFEYFGIPFSFALGWVFFAEAPFDRLIPGVFLIIGGGLLVVWRERQNRKKNS